MLHEIGARRKDSFVEIKANVAIREGGSSFSKKVDEAMGGVLFVDEAHSLDPAHDPQGKAIVDLVLAAAEDCRDDLTIILAGTRGTY